MISMAIRSYARALADIAFESGQADQARAELDLFESWMPQGSELHKALTNPAVPFSAKRKIIEALAGKAPLSRPVTNLILTLLRNARIWRLPDVAEAYRREVDQRQGIQRAEVRSSRPLSEEVQKRLEKEIAQLTGSKVQFDYKTDDSLIGGLKVQIGSTVYDGTVRTQLAEIRRRLASR